MVVGLSFVIRYYLLSNNGLTHCSDFLSGNEVVLKISANLKRSLDTGEVYIPLTDSIDLDVAEVEHSAPERTVYVAGENLGEHALLLGLVEYASLFDYKAVVELNVLRLKLNNVYDDHNCGDDKPEEKNSPELESGEDTLSCYDMRSVYIHFTSPSRQKTP